MEVETKPKEDQRAQMLVEVAEELQRLANSVLREMRRGNSLPCLSSLFAMKPLQSMIASRLTERFEKDDTSEDASTEAVDSEFTIPGYL